MILVSGGAGFVGSVLVKKLVAAGKKVRVLDKAYFGTENLNDVKPKIELIIKDIRDADVRDVEGATSIIHLAGFSNDPTAEYNPKANWEMNTEATERLAEIAKKAGVERFIFGSSCSVYYDPKPLQEIKTEESVINPTAPYSASKLAAEKILLKMRSEKFHPIILRKGTIYGFSPRMRYDLVVNAMTKDAFAHGRLVIHAGGRMWRPLLDIHEACEVYMAMITLPLEKISGQVFNTLSENIQVIDVAKAIRAALSEVTTRPIDLDIEEVGVIRSYRVSGEKLERICGIKPKSSFRRAVTEIWKDLEAGRDFRNPIHYNIRWLELLAEMEGRLKQIGAVF